MRLDGVEHHAEAAQYAPGGLVGGAGCGSPAPCGRGLFRGGAMYAAHSRGLAADAGKFIETGSDRQWIAISRL
jgi:hypothetical protein